MKIAFLLQDTGAVYGAERATIDLASGIAARGHEVRVILIRETRLGLASSALEEAFAEKGLQVVTAETGSRFSIRLICRIRRICREHGVRVLHTVGYKADVHGLYARGRVAQVSTVHGWLFRPDPKERFYGWVNVHALRRCARVVALSRHYEDLLRRKGVPAVRIPSGLDAGSVPAASHQGTFTVGLMGRFSEEKNHAMLLRAVKRLVEAGTTVDVVLAGDGSLRGEVESEIARLDLRHVVKVRGYVPREDFLGSIDALVLCSRIENLPYSVMEAMAAGLPVVATRVGGLPDLVEDGATGYLVGSDDDAALAEALGRLARDLGLRRSMGNAGRVKLATELSPSACIERHLALYSELEGMV